MSCYRVSVRTTTGRISFIVTAPDEAEARQRAWSLAEQLWRRPGHLHDAPWLIREESSGIIEVEPPVWLHQAGGYHP